MDSSSSYGLELTTALTTWVSRNSNNIITSIYDLEPEEVNLQKIIEKKFFSVYRKKCQIGMVQNKRYSDT